MRLGVLGFNLISFVVFFCIIWVENGVIYIIQSGLDYRDK